MCVPGGGNPVATNNSGGGVPVQTSYPQGGSYQMSPPGSYSAYNQPNWISSGLAAANAPLTNYPVGNYGRWNWQNGATNGAGMSASGWPSPSSITQPYGSPQQPYGMQQAAPNFQASNASAQAQPAPFGPGGFGPAPPTGGAPAPGSVGPGGNYRGLGSTMTPEQQAQYMPGATSPANTQSAAASFSQMTPAQQAQYLQQNPRMQAAMVNQGLLSNSAINNLLGGSVYQSASGQRL